MKNNRETCVLAIGRWMPLHNGHKLFLTKLAREYDKLIIGIGSCYENGTARNCIPAADREKLLRKVLKTEGIPDEKIEIVHVPDSETFEEWIGDILEICIRHHVTHFCTGNREDILNVLAEKHMDLNLEMINPEEGSVFPYHATDIRSAIIRGEYEKLDEMIPAEIKEEVVSNLAKEIIRASRGEGQKFIPGRQTVDMVFVVHHVKDGENYILVGDRERTKADFPGYTAIPGGGIEKFEAPANAVLRVLESETGISARLLENTGEPAKVRLGGNIQQEVDMYFTGIYASPDKRVNGTLGGGSQCFFILLQGSIEEMAKELRRGHDLENLRFLEVDALADMRLAYQQKDMIYDSLHKHRVPFKTKKEEMFAELDEDGNPTGDVVTREYAHEKGVLHGASHTYIYRIGGDGRLQMLLQRRSSIKDSFPGCLDTSSAGHVEAGMGFPDTARKELKEELGLDVEEDELQFEFTQRFSDIREFHGKIFNNQEINNIYSLKKDLDPKSLTLQEEEVSEVVWMDCEEIAHRLEDGDEEFCLDEKEYSRIRAKIRERERKR